MIKDGDFENLNDWNLVEVIWVLAKLAFNRIVPVAAPTALSMKSNRPFTVVPLPTSASTSIGPCRLNCCTSASDCSGIPNVIWIGGVWRSVTSVVSFSRTTCLPSSS